MAKYIIRKDNQSKFYWILWSEKNSEIVAMSSEAYESKQGAQKSISWTKTFAAEAEIEDKT